MSTDVLTVTDPVLPPSVVRRRPSFWVIPGRAVMFAGLGFLYGSALRAWMRLVSDDPEFTWSGTIFIVLAFTIGFGVCGLVSGARARGWKGLLVPVRIVAAILCLASFGGAGVIMLPTILLGALALARTDWPRWLRRTLGGLSALSTLPLVVGGPGELGWPRLVVGYVLYLALVCLEIRVYSEPYRPSVGRLPLVFKVVAGAGGVLLVLGVAAMTVGVATSGG